MILLTLLAFLLRAYRLQAQSYWIDEAWTLFYANLSLTELLYNLRTIRAAPPLYHLLTIYWTQWVGDGEYALRFMSLLSGVLAVPLIYRFGRDLVDRRLGLVAALLLTVAPYQVWHAQDARNYSMLTAASIMSMWGFINLGRYGGRRWWLIYVLGTEWAIMTHYHGLVLVGIQGLFLLLTWRRHWRNYPAWAGTLVVILLPVALWLTAGSTLWRSDHWLPLVPLGESYARSAIAYSVGELVPRTQAIPWTLAFVILYGLGLIYAARRTRGNWRGSELLAFLLIYTLVPNLAIWGYSLVGTPVYLERYLIAVQAGYLLTVALGIRAIVDAYLWLASHRVSTQLSLEPAPLLSRILALIVLLLIVGISGMVLHRHYTDPAYAKPDWRGVVDTIEANSLPGDAILMTGDGGEKLFAYYYQGNLPLYTDFNTPAPPLNQAVKRLEQIASGHRRLWYTPYGVLIDATLEQWLAANAYPAWQSWLGRKRLALYNTRAATGRLETLEMRFTGPDGVGPTLDQVALSRQPVAAGDLLPLTLTWQTETLLARDYQLSLRLVNHRGDIFEQSDWPPLAANQPTSGWQPHQPVTDRRSLWLPPDLPPGDYALQLVVYDPLTGDALGPPALLPNIRITPAQIVPPLAKLPIPNFKRRPMGSFSLVGFAAPEYIQPGQEMWLWLFWQAGSRAPSEAVIRLTLSGGDRTVTADWPLSESAGPLAGWQPGQVRRTVYHLDSSPYLTGDQATLDVALLTRTGRLEAETRLTTISLESRLHRFDPPTAGYPLEVALGAPAQVRLIGFDLPGLLFQPGETLPLTLYWQAETEMDTNYTVFVQLLNRAGQVVAQVDVPPQAGAAPTSTWLPGEILTDPYTLPLPANLPQGEYRLITGMYDNASGARLPVTPNHDFVGLETVRVQ